MRIKFADDQRERLLALLARDGSSDEMPSELFRVVFATYGDRPCNLTREQYTWIVRHAPWALPPSALSRRNLSMVRSAAGKAGAAKRWAAERRPTKLIRVYADDAARIAASAAVDGVSAAEIVSRLLADA